MSTMKGVVLAGGLGRRLGRTKGDLLLDGRPLALRAAESLARLCEEVYISLRAGSSNPAPGFPVVEDPPPAGRGPLAGIGAAMARAGRADLLVLACDYPRVEHSLLRTIVDAARPGDDVVLPVDESGREHPLVALWRASSAAAIDAALAEERWTVRELLRGLRTRRLAPARFVDGPLAERLVNLNRVEDLDGV